MVHEKRSSHQHADADSSSDTPVPKLFINGEPGGLLTGPLRELCRRGPNQREVTVPGMHFLPEDAPDAIGSCLAACIRDLP